MFLHTRILTKEKTAPQLPMEYLQQVLLPETGFRLIKEDLMVQRSSDVTDQEAMDTMKASTEFGSMIHSSQDDSEEFNDSETLV